MRASSSLPTMARTTIHPMLLLTVSNALSSTAKFETHCTFHVIRGCNASEMSLNCVIHQNMSTGAHSPPRSRPSPSIPPPPVPSSNDKLPTHLCQQHSSLAMPEPDKRASAQQAVDILHDISTLLVRRPALPTDFFLGRKLTSPQELPARQKGHIHLRIND
jgi:hypothetical protein